MAESNMPEFLTKQFLIAMPSMEDPNFSRSVTVICDHSEEGAMGITINQPTTMFVDEILSSYNADPNQSAKKEPPTSIDISNPEELVYAGGPVQIDRGFILHDSEQHWDSTHSIDGDLKLTTSEDILIDIAQGKGPENSLIALGYAGWSAGQLEEELANNAWLTVPYDADIVFNLPIEKRWQAAASKIGVDLHLISNQTGHA